MSEEKVQEQKRVASAKILGNMVAIDADFACRYPLTPSFSYRTGVTKAHAEIDKKLALFIAGSDPETSSRFEDEIIFEDSSDLEAVLYDLDNIMIEYAKDQSDTGRF